MKVLFISLGCDKNLVDSEFMLGKLTQHKFTVTDDETQADVIVVNTCCFIHDAKEESIQSILDMAQYRTSGSCKALIVCGCLAERYRDEILKEIPEVDAVLGTNSTEQICDAIEKVLLGDKYEAYEPLTGIETHEAKRSVSTGGHYAHLKIAEGCSKHCTYCIIPSIRGDFRSVPMEELLNQARDLAEAGVKELILVAQETTLYGIDLYGKKSLHILLNELNKIPGIYWIRLMYCYPEEIYDELIEAIRDNEKVCHYIDMPIQHINSDILKRMGRKTNREMLEDKIAALRASIPDIAIRTTLICGFPGETPEQHEELMEFLNETEFDRLGAFTYSPEENTPAATFDNQVEESVKEDWQADVMELQEEIILDKNETMIGQEILVMIEGKVADENAYVGRSYRDAPDIDGLVFVNTDEELVSGDFAKVRITGAYEYDLIGELI
ncbi:30S ribosomal protein S12 methylthiotransferase RimO [uncultured Eubacterium sp.]|uniref:30S ribosomal protein S12 methylthiotransferase RimO n=1 Tax=uncultured Eubacterium sp. TaxID=165185 RepID=UPI0025D3C5E3|nr:30S ribosomal protein S12 methylthiotransferase RimO [uncultured Eubacterium sp.]